VRSAKGKSYDARRRKAKLEKKTPNNSQKKRIGGKKENSTAKKLPRDGGSREQERNARKESKWNPKVKNNKAPARRQKVGPRQKGGGKKRKHQKQKRETRRGRPTKKEGNRPPQADFQQGGLDEKKQLPKRGENPSHRFRVGLRSTGPKRPVETKTAGGDLTQGGQATTEKKKPQEPRKIKGRVEKGLKKTGRKQTGSEVPQERKKAPGKTE